MPYRSPARFLAPLALLAAVATIYLVARPELGGSSGGSSAKVVGQSASTAKKAAPKAKKKAPKAKPKVHTVKPGEVLSTIAETTGVSVADLLEFNGLDDAQSLRVGQKLKLAP